MRSPILPIRLITPDPPHDFGLPGDSWLACGISSFVEMEVLCFTPSDSVRGDGIRTPFENVPPRPDHSYAVELAVVLPDLLPRLDGKLEYAIDVALKDMPVRRLAVSNAMSRLRYQLDGKPYQALAHRSVLGRVRNAEIDMVPADAPEEPLRTFVTSQFRLPGATAAEALDEHLSETFDTFVLYLNQLLRIISFVDDDSARIYSTAYTRSTFEVFYFLLIGSSGEPDKIGHGCAMPHAGRTFLNPPPLSAEQSASVRRLLSGTDAPSDIHELIHVARRHLDAGAFDFCVLVSVVAAEVATQRFMVERWLAHGVSKKKLKDYETDYKFSMLLNVEVFFATPPDMKPDRGLIARINQARVMRNAYMHEGQRIKDKATAAGVFQDIIAYIEYIEQVQKHFAADAKPNVGGGGDS